MQVYKFGGASIRDANRIKEIPTIISQYKGGSLLIVVSALGKTTNALERVLTYYMQSEVSQMNEALSSLQKEHYEIIEALFPSGHSIYDDINDTFEELNWILEEEPVEQFDYLYDQVVSFGEFLSSKIVAAYLNEQELHTTWLDVRDCIQTDNSYREAVVDWPLTGQRIEKVVPPLLEKGHVVTQGFLGVTTENFTTTLGREGSDYSAAIFSYCLQVERMTIWKDVPGVLSADPRLFKSVTKLDELSYEEAIELTYYGAQVIHPKTIRPLENKLIPLYVNSFIDWNKEGTIIKKLTASKYPPMIVVKNDQALLKIFSKDFYFVDELKFSNLFGVIARKQVKVNMTQNTALSFSVCVNNQPSKIQALIQELADDYAVEVTEGLKLVTIRYADQKSLEKVMDGRRIYLEERIRNTTQLVIDQNELLS